MIDKHDPEYFITLPWGHPYLLLNPPKVRALGDVVCVRWRSFSSEKNSDYYPSWDVALKVAARDLEDQRRVYVNQLYESFDVLDRMWRMDWETREARLQELVRRDAIARQARDRRQLEALRATDPRKMGRA